MFFSELQRKVFEAAKKQLTQQPWYRGVCTTDFPTDEEIRKDFQAAVDSVCDETALWDSPENRGKRDDCPS